MVLTDSQILTKNRTFPLIKTWHVQTVVLIWRIVWHLSTVCCSNRKQIFNEMVSAPRYLEQTR